LFVYGPFKLGCGLIMVAFHNVWTRTAAVVTAFGWGLVLYKGFFTSVAPQSPTRVGAGATVARTRLVSCVGGRGLVALSSVFWYVVFTR
jgi:hypothetical protein